MLSGSKSALGSPSTADDLEPDNAYSTRLKTDVKILKRIFSNQNVLAIFSGNRPYSRTMREHKDQTEVGSLHRTTLDLLQSSEETKFSIAVATGLTYGWIVAFSANGMRNPSVSKVQRLYEYLTGKPIKLAR
jgi:hypothetical protein